MIKKTLYIAASVLLCITLAACSAENTASEAPELLEPVGVELDFAVVSRMDIERVETHDAYVVPEVTEMYFTVDGAADCINTSLGAYVKKGDVLITLDETDSIERRDELREQLAYLETMYSYDAQIAQAEMEILEKQLEKAVRDGISEADRISMQGNIDMQRLLNSQQDEENARELALIRTEISELDAKIGNNTLTAPFDGTVVMMRDIRKENWINAYDVVIAIADDTHIMVESDYLSESRLNSALELYALINDGRYSLEPVPVDMTEYFSIVFGGGTVMTDCEFTCDTEDVKVGDYALLVVVQSRAEDVLGIPSNALYNDDTGKYVYVLEDGNRVKRTVRTGPGNGLYTQIVDGLEEGDKVYVKE